MKKKLFLAITTILCVLNSLNAFEPIVYTETNEGKFIDFYLPEFNLDSLIINNEFYTSITIPGQPKTFEKGNPALPFFTCSLIIPPDSDYSNLITLESVEFHIQYLTPTPSKGIFSRNIDPETVPWDFSEIYDKDMDYPASVFSVGNSHIIRDFSGITLKIFPFSYNGKTRSVTIFDHIRFSIALEESNAKLPNLNNHINPSFQNIYENHFLNYKHDRYTSIDESGKMIIIAYPAFVDEVQPLVDWKNAKGLPTTLYTLDDTGTSATDIKEFIQTQYDTDNDLTFVLLVGDINQITSPISSLYHSGYADPMYAQLAGDDYYPEIFIGRLSAENGSQVTTQVNKILYYERDMETGDWAGKGVGIASQQGTGDDNEYDYEHIRNIRTDLMGYTYSMVDEIYEGSQGGEDEPTWPSASDVAASFNNGRGIANYCGHGSYLSWGTSGFSTSYVNTLTNDNMLPFIISVACKNGAVDYSSPCFAETWLRATHNGNLSGAIAFYGSSVNQLWAPPMASQDEITDLLTSDQKQTFGGLCFNGSCLMMDEYGSYHGADTFNTWLIFGDPSLVVRTQSPLALNVDYPEIIIPDSSSIDVTSIPGTQICLSDSSYQILFNDVIDASGVLSIPTENLIFNNQSINLTATQYNHVSFTGSIILSDGITPLPVPQNVKAAIQNNQIVISWNAVDGASSYKIFYSQYPDREFILLDTVNASTLSKSYNLFNHQGFFFIKASDSSIE